VATSACSAVPNPIFWASARRSTIRALLSSGSGCLVAPSISESRSGTGRVASSKEKELAEQLAANVSDVEDVKNNLVVDAE
jgi:hypothetical protein